VRSIDAARRVWHEGVLGTKQAKRYQVRAARAFLERIGVTP
jgi:hypothetical protein